MLTEHCSATPANALAHFDLGLPQVLAVDAKVLVPLDGVALEQCQRCAAPILEESHLIALKQMHECL